MQPIVDEHAVAEPDLDARPSRRPSWFSAIMVAAMLVFAGYWVLNKYAGHKVIHCPCKGGEQQQVVDLWRSTDAACQALCAKTD